MDAAPMGKDLVPPPLPPDGGDLETSLTPGPSARGLRVVELCLVLLVAFGPTLLTSFADFLPSFFSTGGRGPDYTHRAPRSVGTLLSGDVRYIASLAVCAYVLFRQRRSFRQLGLTWRKMDLFVATALAVASYLAYRTVYTLLWESGFRAALAHGINHYMDGVGTGATVGYRLAISAYWVWHAAVVGAFEEVIVRGYLMTEITVLTRSIPLAILASVTLQSSYHLYQGWPSALSHVAGFLVFALFYSETWRLTPVVLAHMFLDLNAELHQTWA